MKILCFLCACILLGAVKLGAQIVPCSDPGGTVVDSMTVQSAFDAVGAATAVLFEVYVERSSVGQINYRVDVSSIRCVGDDGIINETSTVDLFNIIGKAAATAGVNKGYTPCSVACDQPAWAKVLEAGCVIRNGSGTGTRFLQCSDSGCCMRLYAVCCPNGPGNPIVTLVRTEGPTCQAMGGCQATCP